MRHTRYLFPGVLIFVLLSINPGHPFAATPDKDQVIAKYEQAVMLVEEQRLSQRDAESIKPKVRLAGQALLENDLATANRILEGALTELETLRKTQSPASRSDFRLEWLETYANVFQWFAVLAILAFFLTRWPYFRSMLLGNHLSFIGQAILAGLAAFFAVLLSLLDLSRYGESSWMFFDIQLVLVTVGGLLGGIVPGVIAGAIVAVFRYALKPVWSVYPFLVLGAGLAGGILSLRMRNFQESAKIALVAGLLAGLIHGLCVYLPLDPLISWTYVVFAVAVLTVLEGTGVFLFFAVVGGILREEVRQQMQQELLKTKLLFLQAQLRPHFFFNALNTISVICGREKALQAQQLIFRLADFLRHTLKRESESVTLKEEMTFIDDYLEIEKARFQDKLQVHKELQIAAKTWEVKIPLLILQPLVENAIGHGIRKRETGGNLWILADDREGVLKIEIVDDGAGAEPGFFERLIKGDVSTVEGLGIGVRNIHQRLTRYFNGKAKLSFETKKDVGTNVTVTIPLEFVEKQA